MKPVVIDVETTIFQKGNPFSDRNKLCYLGAYDGISYHRWRIDGFGEPYGSILREIADFLRAYDLLVGFNVKFDLNWLKRYGISVSGFAVFDLQLCEFIITGQGVPFPSLDATCLRCNLPAKFHNISESYWAKDVDTPDIPQNEMEEYLYNDCKIEWDLFQWQIKHLADKPKLKRLIWDSCQDLKSTSEMETNGILWDMDLSEKMGNTKLERIKTIDTKLDNLVGRVGVNWNSGDWLSAVLYGGTVFVEGTETYEFIYKDGRQVNKERKTKVPVVFQRLVEPLKNSGLKKVGFWGTNEGVLRKLKATRLAKKIIELILERTKIETQVSRYLHGIPELYREMDWSRNFIHGQLQHCTARTGRLASSRPNIQNLDPEAQRCVKTRFPKQPISR